MDSKVSRFRVIAFVEGISFLLLLFIAMPLKYIYGIPEATKIMGSLHGILFIAFCFLLMEAARAHRWVYTFGVLAFISSLVPFGMIWLDRRLKKPQAIPLRA